jgi:RimJ/RimL family protein N-acetyltransferase
MTAPAELETARLRLRRPRLADAASIYERYASDPEVTRFLGWPRHQAVADTEAFLRFSDEAWRRWPAGPYLILARAGGQLLGGTGLDFQSPHDAATGYVLANDAWGRGFATEALTAIVEIAGTIGVTRLWALCHPDHRASQRVLEKCGFERDPAATRQIEFPNLAPGLQQDAYCYVRAIARC